MKLFQLGWSILSQAHPLLAEMTETKEKVFSAAKLCFIGVAMMSASISSIALLCIFSFINSALYIVAVGFYGVIGAWGYTLFLDGRKSLEEIWNSSASAMIVQNTEMVYQTGKKVINSGKDLALKAKEKVFGKEKVYDLPMKEDQVEKKNILQKLHKKIKGE